MEKIEYLFAKTEIKVEKQEALKKNQTSFIHNVKVQVRQIVNLLSARTQGSLMSNIEKNPKKQVHVITLKSEKELEHVQKSFAESVHQKKNIIREVKESQRNTSPRSTR